MEDLPVEVMADIMSRLPVKTIIHCKCVCKKWLKIVLDPYFADLQLSRTPVGIMVHHKSKKEMRQHFIPGILKWVEVEDELDDRHFHHDPVMSLDLNLASIFQKSEIRMVGNSVDGLICLWQFDRTQENNYICNPITREYMILPKKQYGKKDYYAPIYCLGVGLMTKEYKVIRISQEIMPPNPTLESRSSLLEVEAYTLGSGQWRSLGHVPYMLDSFYRPFLNGHAHWIVVDHKNHDSDEKLCAFDFDKETFKLFPSPPSEDKKESKVHFQSLGVLKGCLCLCDTYDFECTVWVMKEYGIKKSWQKEFVIERRISPNFDLLGLMKHVLVMESFKCVPMLVVSYQDTLLVYCHRRNTFVYKKKLFNGCINGLVYRPSFHRLHNFKNERIHMF